MRDFMVTLLICSVTMSGVAVLHMAFTPLLAKRYAEKWRYYAWIVIVAGLIVPFRPHFGNAILNVEMLGVKTENIMTADSVIGSIRILSSNNILSGFTDDSAGIDIFSEPVINSVEDTVILVASQITVIDWSLVISIVWLIGMTGFLAYHMINHYRFNKTAGRWSKTIIDRQTLELFSNLKAEMNISRNVGLQVCPLIGSPMLIGLFRPRILLPKVDLSKRELYFILKHELVHYRRKDILYKYFTLIAEAMHWFNPFIHLVAKAIGTECEQSCDAEVVSGTDAETRQHYSETIIGIARYRSKIKTILSTNFYGGKKGMKNRILSIADKSKKRKGVVLICFALILTICTSLVIAANAPSNDNPALNTISDSVEENSDINRVKDENDNIVVSGTFCIGYVNDYGEITTRLSCDGGITWCNKDEKGNLIPDENISEIEWLTYEGFREWIDKKKVELQELVGTSYYTADGGSFEWTQEEIDEKIVCYESDLEDLKNGIGTAGKIIIGNVDYVFLFTQSEVTVSNTEVMASESIYVTIYDSETGDMYSQEVTAEQIPADEAMTGNMIVSGSAAEFMSDGVKVIVNDGMGAYMQEFATKCYVYRFVSDDGDDIMGFGAHSYKELCKMVKNYFDERIQKGKMTREEADAKLAKLSESGTVRTLDEDGNVIK